MKKLLIKTMLLSGAVLLSACGHDNPVMKAPDFETLLSYVSESRFMSRNQQSDAWVCPAFFAHPSEEATDKNRCKKWMTFLYEKETGDFEAEAELTGKSYTKPTFEDFSDPAVWQAIVEKLDRKEKL